MGAYLITGESGTGKSSLAVESQKRGYIAYDADRTPDLTYHAVLATGELVTEKLDHYADTDWVWDGAKLRELLANPKDIFITGASSNQQDSYSLFTEIFILTIDVKTLTQRLQNRKPGNYGMHPDELKDILGTFEGFARREIENGAIPVQPLAKVADDILSNFNQKPKPHN